MDNETLHRAAALMMLGQPAIVAAAAAAAPAVSAPSPPPAHQLPFPTGAGQFYRMVPGLPTAGATYPAPALINPGGSGGAFRPVAGGAAPKKVARLFSRHRHQLQSEDAKENIVSGFEDSSSSCSNGRLSSSPDSAKLPSSAVAACPSLPPASLDEKVATTTAAGPTGITPAETEAAELRAERQGRNCPICNLALAPGAHAASLHLHQEMERLQRQASYFHIDEKEWPSSPQDGTSDDDKMAPVIAVVSGESTQLQQREGRDQAFGKIRNNRQARFGMKLGRQKKVRKSEVECPICHDKIAIGQVSTHADVCVKQKESRTAVACSDEMFAASDEEIDVEGDDEEDVSGVATAEDEDEDDGHLFGDVQFSQADVSSAQTSVEDKVGENGESSADDRQQPKCSVCLSGYKWPVVSVNCWHVFCRNCWLAILGGKKSCPECHVSSSPKHLRQIYL